MVETRDNCSPVKKKSKGRHRQVIEQALETVAITGQRLNAKPKQSAESEQRRVQKTPNLVFLVYTRI